jgi:perosamine synthetase
MSKKFSIPFGGRGHWYTPEELEIAQEVMKNAKTLTQGEHRDSFEKKFSEYAGVEHSFAVSNATMGLEIVAQLCLFEVGDEVIIPAHTFTSTAYPFVKAGAEIVWADIDAETGCVTESTIRDRINEKTKAIVVTHLYGLCVEMPSIVELAKNNGLILIEDAAQALGATFNGKMAGTFGDFGIFSFHSHKNVTTLGEGGMVVLKDSDMAEVVPQIRHNGHTTYSDTRLMYWKPAMSNLEIPKYQGQRIWPMNCCLGEVECAVGTKLIDRIGEINQKKRDRALWFIDQLAEYSEIVFHRNSTKQHCYHLLIGQMDIGKRDHFIQTMSDTYGIQCIVQYCPLYRYPFYQEIGLSKHQCPNTDVFFDQMISFPFSHLLSDDQLFEVVQATKSTLGSREFS